jgi:hypothetical protein
MLSVITNYRFLVSPFRGSTQALMTSLSADKMMMETKKKQLFLTFETAAAVADNTQIFASELSRTTMSLNVASRKLFSFCRTHAQDNVNLSLSSSSTQCAVLCWLCYGFPARQFKD